MFARQVLYFLNHTPSSKSGSLKKKFDVALKWFYFLIFIIIVALGVSSSAIT
jgi:hypothetical protein